MKFRPFIVSLCILLSSVAARPALAVTLANRVFVSARSGNNANACDNINTPCQSFAGAVTQLNPDGELIVLDSGGYGPVTITQGVTIEAAPGVTAFIHPPSGDAITISAGSSGNVTLRGLTLNAGTNNGITVNSVGTLNIENCFISGFTLYGLHMLSAGQLNIRGTSIKACFYGIFVAPTVGPVRASIDHCHLDANSTGYYALSTDPGGSATTATFSTADSNSIGWICGNSSTGKDVLILDSCTGSENDNYGLFSNSANALSAARYANCVFANNGARGVAQMNAGAVQTRGNNTISGNTGGSTSGTVTSFVAQ
jgi:hypothetical protein